MAEIAVVPLEVAAGSGDGPAPAVAAAGSGPAPPMLSQVTEHQQEKPIKKRRKLSAIDLDDHIRSAQTAMKNARFDVALAKNNAKNERRKKQRLMKRASGLSPEDLERMAILKRCGLWGPATSPRNTWPPGPTVAGSGNMTSEGEPASSSTTTTGQAPSTASSPAGEPERVQNTSDADMPAAGESSHEEERDDMDDDK